MGSSDSGMWRPFLYVFIILFIVAGILSVILIPFSSHGIGIPTNIDTISQNAVSFIGNGIQVPSTTVFYGLIPIPSINVTSPFVILGKPIQSFIVNDIQTFFYIPNGLRIPIEIIGSIAIIYVIYLLLTSAL